MSLSLGIGLGLSQQRIGGGADNVLEYRNHTSTVATDTNPTVPSGIVAGDLLIAWAHAISEFKSPSTPLGWTSIDSAAGSVGSSHAIVKIADGTETGSLELFATANIADNGLCLALKGGLASLGSIVDTDAARTDNDPPAQVKNASTLGVLPFVVVGLYASDGTVDPRTFTGDTADDEKGETRVWIKWKFYGADDTPSDITIDMDDEGVSNVLTSAIIEVVF